MKTLRNLLTISMVSISGLVFAQVQINKPIQLTGGAGERMLTNLETPVNGTDAVNKDYVDAAVAASGGSSPFTMMSQESPSPGSLGDAMRYCNTLNESGYTDWKLPRFLEIMEVASKGGNIVPNASSSNFIWIADGSLNTQNYSTSFFVAMRLSDGVVTYATPNTLGSRYIRCVR